MVRLGDGMLDLPQSEPGLAPMMTLTSAAAGLKKHSLDDLKEMLAGKVVSVGTTSRTMPSSRRAPRRRRTSRCR